MYKKQLIWQKILCFAALAACGIVFLYALGLSTDLFDGLFYTLPEEAKLATSKVNVPGAEVYYDIQPFNRQLLNNTIVLLLAGCFLFMTNTHSRRKYYISNTISTFAFAGGGIAVSLWGHEQISAYKQQFLQIDFEAYQKYATRRRKEYIDSTFWFDAHYLVFALLVLVCLALVANYFWKLYLMRAEKKLIEAGKGGL
ncbi:MAG: hypothetical protein E7336_01490 [Clostridiales bacterium]|nr:hypothetical protein [Clostridiales bacterium]